MKATVVSPGQKNSVRLAEVPKPTLAEIPVPPGEPPLPAERGVLVRVLKVGADATDREINDGLCGAPPPGKDY